MRVIYAAMGHQHDPSKLRAHIQTLEEQPPLLGYHFAYEGGRPGGTLRITPVPPK